LTTEIQIESYRFWSFKIEGNLVTFLVAHLIGRDVTEEDIKKVKAILDDLGKWENLVKTGLHLFSELKIGNIQQADLQNYDRSFGKELYEMDIKKTNDDIMRGTVLLVTEERHIREEMHVEPIFSDSEMYNQIDNIKKWRTLEKTLLHIGIKK
jgi:hypothetical protein